MHTVHTVLPYCPSDSALGKSRLSQFNPTIICTAYCGCDASCCKMVTEYRDVWRCA